jgi:hypothetical protein
MINLGLPEYPWVRVCKWSGMAVEERFYYSAQELSRNIFDCVWVKKIS